MTSVAEIGHLAKHAHPTFADTVTRYGPDANDLLARFSDLDLLDQALVVLNCAKHFPLMLECAMRWVDDEPCFQAQCGHPRHRGECELCECYR